MKSERRTRLLVSNDDGYRSFFLRALVEELCHRFEVYVVAPRDEQSWVGRAMTRRGLLEVEELQDWPCPAWSVTGRPADCVNIGLHHLLPVPADAVVSGMNLGFNTTLTLTLGSGTVAAATEGALAGLPAIAFSLSIPHDQFQGVSEAHGHRGAEGDQITRIAAQRAAEITEQLLKEKQPLYSVHNVNFPPSVTQETPVDETELALNQIPSLFQPVQAGDEDCGHLKRSFSFSFSSSWAYTHNPSNSDIETLKRGSISHSLLRWDQLTGNR